MFLFGVHFNILTSVTNSTFGSYFKPQSIRDIEYLYKSLFLFISVVQIKPLYIEYYHMRNSSHEPTLKRGIF